MGEQQETQGERWVSISDAAKHFGVGRAQVSKLIKRKNTEKPGSIETRQDSVDNRLVLVNLAALEPIYKASVKYQKHSGEEGSDNRSDV